MTCGNFTRLRGDIESDLAELSARDRITCAEQLVSTGEPFNSGAIPQYFVGDLDAKLVMVMLNPGGEGRHIIPVPTVEEYLAMFRTFGYDHFGPHRPCTESRFDDKQVEFHRPFGRFDFEPPSEDCKSRNRNRVTVLDRKLQLELIPYPSPQLKLAPGQSETLKWHLERVIETIVAAPRDLVIFTGAILESLLTVAQDHRFRVEKSDGTMTADQCRFARLDLHKSLDNVWWAPTFARRGIPMRNYGTKCAGFVS